MFQIVCVAATATLMTMTSNAAPSRSVNYQPDAYYQEHGRVGRMERILNEACRLFAAECSSPPPCPVWLASLPMPIPEPPEARTGVVWLSHVQGAVRERRALRDGVEKKDARSAY